MKRIVILFMLLVLFLACASAEEAEITVPPFAPTGVFPLSEAAPVAGSSEDYSEPQAYILHVVDQDGSPVPGMAVTFCTDTTCFLLQADENGIITFGGEPDVYHLQLLKAPEGYSFDAEFEMVTDRAYGEWLLCIRKD